MSLKIGACGKPISECTCPKPLKKKSIKGFKTILPDKSAFTIETKPDFPKLHTLTLVSGKRGGGKTVSTVNFVKRCQDENYFDRVLLITPTYHSNKSIFDICNIAEEDVYEPSKTVLKTIKGIIEAEREEWDLFLYQKELYKKLKKDLRKPEIEMDENTLIEYYDFGMFNKKPVWKYKQERPPRLALIIDDAMGTPLLLPSAGLTRFIIAHRHWGQGLGISVFMLVQSYCSKEGIARPIRENCTALWLFRLSDDKQIKKVREEADLPVSDEDFQNMCKQCWSVQYNFLFIDFNPKTEEQRFRSGFSEYLVPASLNKDLKT